MIAKNEKGEVVSSPIEVKELVEEKVDKPSIGEKLKSVVSNLLTKMVWVIFLIFSTHIQNYINIIQSLNMHVSLETFPK